MYMYVIQLKNTTVNFLLLVAGFTHVALFSLMCSSFTYLIINTISTLLYGDFWLNSLSHLPIIFFVVIKKYP